MYRTQYNSRNRHLSHKAQEARDIARFFGGKALIGTQKQKEWAEKIREEKILSMNEDQAILACDSKGLGRSAKFWIENRNRTPDDIGQFFIDQKVLLATAMKLRDAGLSEEYADASKVYNQLTEDWGFA